VGKYLITGRGGTGKSTIALELQRRGYPAFDGDKVPQLARWEDRSTGQPLMIDPAGYIDFEKVAWAWNAGTLTHLLTTHDNLFLCGSSSNQSDYYASFDIVFILTLDPPTHDLRLSTRASDYGKHPDLRRKIVVGHQKFAKELLAAGAIPIDVTQPLERVVDTILGSIQK
jgi:broad-specificity NMP kinase